MTYRLRCLAKPVALLASVALAAIACATESQGCDLCTTSAIVYGTVRDTADQPVPNTLIRVDAFQDSCTAGTPIGTVSIPASSGAAGAYRARPFSGFGPFQACLRVTAYAPAGSPWSDTVLTGAVVRFREDFGSGPHDSVQVDVVLAP
jgi:hypothetical protein